MFNQKIKIDSNLKESIAHNQYQKYRVMIKCKNLFSTILKKVSSFKDALIFPIEYCNIIVANLNKHELTLISEYPEVEKIFFDEYLFLCGISVSSANNYYRNISSLHYDGRGIKIGIIDSGVYPHIDLNKPSKKIFDFYDTVNNFSYPYDDNGHGTAIAGIICGSGISSDSLYSGIAPLSNIISYKAFDALGKGFASSILFSIEDIIKKYKEHNLRILCLPFEMLNLNYNILNAFSIIFDKAVSLNIIPIVPTGSKNVNDNNLCGLGTLKNCITVAGVFSDSNKKPYTYSSSSSNNKSKKPNFSMPCTNITTLNSDISFISEKDGIKLYPKKLDAKYKTFSGTSLSVATVSAICALILQYNSNLNINDVISIINLACKNENNIPKNIIGEGIININNILK